jgi:hypothetical protein
VLKHCSLEKKRVKIPALSEGPKVREDNNLEAEVKIPEL